MCTDREYELRPDPPSTISEVNQESARKFLIHANHAMQINSQRNRYQQQNSQVRKGLDLDSISELDSVADVENYGVLDR